MRRSPRAPVAATDELVQEAIELWQQERARALAEFRKSLDDAEDSIARGEGIDINPEAMRQLSKDVIRVIDAAVMPAVTPTNTNPRQPRRVPR